MVTEYVRVFAFEEELVSDGVVEEVGERVEGDEEEEEEEEEEDDE